MTWKAKPSRAEHETETAGRTDCMRTLGDDANDKRINVSRGAEQSVLARYTEVNPATVGFS